MDEIHNTLNILDENSKNMGEGEYLILCNNLKVIYKALQKADPGNDVIEQYEDEIMALREDLENNVVHLAHNHLGHVVEEMLQDERDRLNWKCKYCKKNFRPGTNKKRHYKSCKIRRKWDYERKIAEKNFRKIFKIIKLMRIRV
tara:strand:+ start:1448 stop:1879 length:432 start_codon:yes stop_codon:yes gene_type:complete